MKTIASTLFILAAAIAANAQEWKPQEWPVLKHYEQNSLYQISMPVGGIGTGTVSLGGRGELRDWEIMNIPGKNYSTVQTGNNAPFFAIYVSPQNEESTTTLLAGPLYPHEYLQAEGLPANHHGLPRFASASFDAAYPFGQVRLADEALPVAVSVKAFNPLIPADEESSGLPIAIFAYEVTNTNSQPIAVSVCGSLRNFIGRDGSSFRNNWYGNPILPAGAKANRNTCMEANGAKGIHFTSEGVDPNDPAFGNIALTAHTTGKVTHRTSSKTDNWSNAILNFWDDFSDDGELTERTEPITEDDPMGSLAIKKTIEPGATETFTFYLTWNFPNRKAWAPVVVGNYYSQKYPNAWQTALDIIPRMPQLERRTLQFVNALLQSTYPEAVKEAALFNIAVLRSQTVFRLPDGHLMAWEGAMDRYGSCHGSCTHVWNYEVTTPFLFGTLARSMRDVEFAHAVRPDNGLMNFRAALPLSEAAKGQAAAADGQMGTIMKAYREWQLSGDNNFLATYWPNIRKALAYAWTDKGWDANRDGVMEGAQHNTMDIDYYGPNPEVGFWYLGALKAAHQMAVAMKDKDFAEQCLQIFRKGSRWIDANLFNGEYYEQKITDPATFEFLDMNHPGVKIPSYQLGPGCLVDQLVGQYMAHICGLGYLADKNNIRTALASIMKYNYKPNLSRHFNNMRSYAMANEAGLLIASWPKGRLQTPFPYFAEVWTGLEYCAAGGMIYEGMEAGGLQCIQAVRARYDGAKRNPFSEPECGHNYARSMSSWSAILALSKFHYSGISHSMSLTAQPGIYFWSNGYAWGQCTVSTDAVKLQVLHGKLTLNSFHLTDGRTKKLGQTNISEGESHLIQF
ncbi:MAG: hypothetical protein LBD21_02275 [Tannerellaceae bacterium]|jgi:uncharacterized protein (DUF608 family)|nr:hypothetical protein [Tannerellaceae bacterium]